MTDDDGPGTVRRDGPGPSVIVGGVSVPPQVSPPEFAFTDAAPSRVVGAGVVALPVLAGADGPELGPGAAEVVDDLGLDLLELLDVTGCTGVAGSVAAVPLTIRPDDASPSLNTVLLVGVGTADPAGVRRAGAALAQHTTGESSVATTIPSVGGPECLTAFVEGAVLGSFSYTLRTTEPETPAARIVLAGTSEPDDALLARALAIAGAGWRSRELASVPSNVKNPQWMVDQATAIARQAGLKARVWDEKQLEAEGFGGIVAVGRASVHPPRLLRLDYSPAKGARSAPHVVLVGKGITFDTGGLNIKPGESMVNMKRDMTGAAVVLAVMAALGDVGCPVKVTGLLPLAENAIGADAMRPGDVLHQYGGRTTEVTNTDAEGRLVLADGLAYAVREIEPDVLVDVATLTGAMRVAMGQRLGGLFATHDALAEGLVEAGAAAGEPVWRMPLASEYEDLLRSRVADAQNAPASAAAITAALFMKPFTGGLPWAHLDLASVGDSPEANFEWTPGPTGFGPRLLLRWLGGDPVAGLEGRG